MQRDPAAPPDLDGYTAVRVLGVGGFSDVFLYRQELPQRQVAVKVLSGDLTDEVRAAFVREANLMAALSSHPYIVTIHQAGVAADGRPYLVMEYCSRPSLAERYKRRPLSVADALRTGVRIAGAVATLHGAGILHRDIKPANVLTNDYGWPALTDFGIATSVDEAAAEGDGTGGDAAGSTIGLSVPWSPPEMFVDVPDPDVRSDVFSLAATLYTALAGRTPFEVSGGPNGPLELMARIERGEVTPMTRDDLPASLQAALARGMAPDREDRWPTALEFARALQRIELELGYAPTSIEVPSVEGDPKRGEGEDGDATRVRVVTTVLAQPEAVPSAHGPENSTSSEEPPSPTGSPDEPELPAPAPAPAAEQTAVQAVGPSAASAPTTAPPAAPEPDPRAVHMPSAASASGGPADPLPPPAAWSSGWPDVPRRRRRGRAVALVIGGLALLAIAAIVIAILLGGIPVPSSGVGPVRTGAPAVGAALPRPIGGTAAVSDDGTSVTFAWTNPSPEPDDGYYWARSETPDERQETSRTSVAVADVVPGSRVCIDVALGRAGRTSAPVRICTS